MDYKAYPHRWLLLGILCVVSFSLVYSGNGFVLLNNVVCQYYQATPYQIDLLGVAGNILALPIGMTTAYFSDVLSLRTVMLGLTAAITIGSSVCIIGFLSRGLFFVTAIGRLIMASLFGTLFTAQVILASNWFPSNETATAFSIPMITLLLGGILASQIYPAIIPNVTYQNTSDGLKWDQEFKVKSLFCTTYGILSSIALLCLILTFVYCKDHPPSPPSQSQAKLIEMRKIVECGSRTKTMLFIIRKRPFILIVISSIFSQVTITFGVYLLPSAVLITFPHLQNTVPGNVLLLATAGQASVVITGRLLDKFKLFKLMTLIGSLTAILSCVGLYFAHSNKHLISIYIFYTTLNIALGIFMPSGIELIIETTYPANNLSLMSIYMAFTNFSVFLFTTINRELMTRFSVEFSALASAGFLLITTVGILFVNADYRRQKANIKEKFLNSNEDCEMTEQPTF